MNKKLIRHDIERALVKKCGLSREESREATKLLLAEIVRLADLGHKVSLPGVACFNFETKSARPGRNPKTGEMYVVKGRRIFRASISKTLTKRIGVRADG